MPLHVAAFAGHANIVHYLVQNNADIQGTTKQQETALHFAVRGNHQDVVRILLRNGSFVEVTDRDGRTPLHITSEHGNAEIIKTLLSHGARVDAKTGKQWTPLHMAAKTGQVCRIVLILHNSRAGKFSSVDWCRTGFGAILAYCVCFRSSVWFLHKLT